MVDQLYDKRFWSKAEEIVLFSELLVRVLRMVDSDKFVMGFVYEDMDQAKEQIKTAYGDKRWKYIHVMQPAHKIEEKIDQRLRNQPLRG